MPNHRSILPYSPPPATGLCNSPEKLQRKVSDKRTESIKDLFSCPVEIWKSSNRTLLDLTHTSDPVKSHLSTDEDSYKCIDLKQCCTDILEGNFLCEGNFQDERYRFDLQLMESCHSATFLGILYDQAALDKFACLLKHAIKSVSVQMSQKKWMAKTDSEKMSQTDDGLSEDTELLISMLGSVAKHVDEPDDNEGEIFCYSTSMFLCSLAEKLLRLLYIHLLLLKGEDVPSDIRLGMLLSADNDKMTKVFGSVHIQLLACFLIGMPGIKSGPSYRNSLAHWSSGMSPDKMTPKLVSSLLWLFTDILNSIVLYFNPNFFGDYRLKPPSRQRSG